MREPDGQTDQAREILVGATDLQERDMPGNGSSARACAHRVLIIDSDGAMRRLLRLALEEFGCDAFEARDGPETLELLRDHPMCAVIVDIPGPSVSRWSALKALSGQRMGRQVATIAISSDYAALMTAAKLPVDVTLLKPFSLQQLRTVIEHLTAQEEPPHAPMLPFRLPSIGARSPFTGDTTQESFSHHPWRSQHYG